mgnify:CR=1 FL=1
MRGDKPSIKDILKLDEKLRSDIYNQVHLKFDEDEKYYELNFAGELELPTELADDATVLPTARDMVDSAVDHTDTSNLRINVNKKGLTQKSAEEAEMEREFYLGLNYRTNTETSISPMRVAKKHYWLHGVTFIKTLWDADRWPDKPIQKEGESNDTYDARLKEWQGTTSLTVPIIIQAVHPKIVMPDPDHIEPQFFIEHHKKATFNMRRYPKWKNPKNKEIDEDVEWIEFWDDTYKCYLADGEPVLPFGGVVKHKYGFIPYVEIDSGLGNLSHDAKIEMRWVGLLRYMLPVLRAESRNYSLSDIILKKGALPGGYVTGENAKLITDIKTYYGNWAQIPEGVELHQLTPEVPPDALRQWMAITSDIIAGHAATRSTRGMSEEGVRSSIDRRLMIAEGGARYAYSRDSFKNGMARVFINCLRLYKYVVPGDVRLWARSATVDFDKIIKKDLLKEPFTCYPEYAPISEEDEYRRHDDLERLVNSRIVTPKWARTQMSNVDPIEMEREEERELLKNSPAIVEGKNQLLAIKWAAAVAKRSAAEGTTLVTPPPLTPPITPPATQEPMGGMTTRVPQRAIPGSPEEAQLKLKGLRSQTPQFPGQGQFGGGSRRA